MKSLYILIKLEYYRLLLPTCTLMAITAFFEIILFEIALEKAGTNTPLAYLIDTSGIPIVFFISFLALLSLTVFCFIQNYTPSKNIYALLSLPVRREYVYYSKLISSFITMLYLTVMQLGLLMIAVKVYNHVITNRSSSAYEAISQNAVLYITLLRSQFLRILFPPDIYSLMFSIFGLIGAVCLTLSVSTHIKAGNIKKAEIFTILWLFLILNTFPLTDYKQFHNNIKLCLLAVFPYYVSLSGIKIFITGEVAD